MSTPTSMSPEVLQLLVLNSALCFIACAVLYVVKWAQLPKVRRVSTPSAISQSTEDNRPTAHSSRFFLLL